MWRVIGSSTQESEPWTDWLKRIPKPRAEPCLLKETIHVTGNNTTYHQSSQSALTMFSWSIVTSMNLNNKIYRAVFKNQNVFRCKGFLEELGPEQHTVT